MDLPAPAKMNGDDGKLSFENFGLSILDMVKHAARTILSTLDEGDRLGIVTFSKDATASFSSAPRRNDYFNKELSESNIDMMTPDSMTNLWHGLQKGIGLFEGEEDTGRVPAVMILTDGLPNYLCPAQGYIPKIRSIWEDLPATIHTFGFGYDIKSGLLKSIAEIGGGNYAFIPDAGMIGTVFVHAAAHLQTTYATKCSLQVTMPNNIRLRTTTGKTVDQQVKDVGGNRKLTVRLGNLQYGQSRDIYLENIDSQGYKAVFDPTTGTTINAMLRFTQMRAAELCSFGIKDVLEDSILSESEMAYHRSRSMICDFISSFFPLRNDGEYETRKDINVKRHAPDFQRLLENIPARLYDDKHNRSLMEDLVGSLPSGQVSLALSDENYFRRWGCHYFFSLWNAHAKQLCNSFKDPGPLLYNQNPFFIRCRDRLDRSFDTIPPPKQSCPSVATTPHIYMSRLNTRSGPCFTGTSKVTLANGHQALVRKLRRGSAVRTPIGSRIVAAVLKTEIREVSMCRIGDLVITPWHPIRIDHAGTPAQWTFPAKLVLVSGQVQLVTYSGPIYSVLLGPDCSTEAHALEFGGVWAAALGHGVVRGRDVRAHRFLGDYKKVAKAIARLKPRKDGVALSGGVKRRDRDGLVCGFKEYATTLSYV
ncbi:hint-domain-containing protein [Annulohypoxylon maeteangense]|uniref:hint-domain-containing protein n=1 Tax=Annulohypoxylon maeteangense TaxID=1927788 RepID=UPI0020088997|nr:hint-domain-containing protein [Annulohypoxylon maeteangense]KAI0888530.1 hint-domain-containing protein [Annulohypoxylon maeteangense]